MQQELHVHCADLTGVTHLVCSPQLLRNFYSPGLVESINIYFLIFARVETQVPSPQFSLTLSICCYAWDFLL